jgi:molybdopterin/thiamine biosynthesis adenylyltransferase
MGRMKKMNENLVDSTRHSYIFDPHKFGDTRIDIVGVGATGSRVALSLAKLGITNIHVWDFDKVERHNVANQIFGLSDIDKFKVDALGDFVKTQTGLEVTRHNEAVTGRTRLGSVVFLLTDSMASRKEIFEGAIKNKPSISLMIETRMGASEGRVYTINPIDPDDVKFWLGTLYEDKDAQVSLCGTPITVGPTAEFISSMAVWQFITWWKHTSEGKDRPNKDVMCFTTPTISVYSYK